MGVEEEFDDELTVSEMLAFLQPNKTASIAAPRQANFWHLNY